MMMMLNRSVLLRELKQEHSHQCQREKERSRVLIRGQQKKCRSRSHEHSIFFRDGSTMRTRRNKELFERPVMHVLDNVSAISLDEFWSNKKP